MATEQIKYSNAELYVHLHPSYFAYTIYNLTTDQYEGIVCSMHDGRHTINKKELSSWLKSNQFTFNQAYKQTKLGINATAFSLLDHKALASMEHFSVLNDFNNSTDALLIDNSLDDLIVQFAVKKSILKTLYGYFDKKDIGFGDIGNLKINNQLKNTFVSAQVLNNELSITVVKEKKLVLFNKYTFKNNDDLLYYILLNYQANELNTNRDQLYLFGLIESNSSMYQLIYDYIKHVEIVATKDVIGISPSESQLASHYFFNLLNYKS